MMKLLISALFLAILLLSVSQSADAGRKRYSDRHEVRKFVRIVAAEHNLNRAELLGLFRKAKRQQDVLDAISKPAERKLIWSEYQPIFVTEDRAKAGVEFWRRYSEALRRAEQEYGVPAEIVVAIIGVETYYGKILGRYPVFESLVTLGFDGKRRRQFFRSELEAFLLLARDEKLNPMQVKGSYAGAMGFPQFISSSYRAYAVDYDNDGYRDLFANPVDAIGSVANYFARHGWRRGEEIVIPVQLDEDEARSLAVGRGRQGLKPELSVGQIITAGVKLGYEIPPERKAVLIELEKPEESEYWLGLNNFYVMTRYNNSSMYAMAVYQLGNRIKQYLSVAQNGNMGVLQ